MECPVCELRIEGRFRETSFQQLGPKELDLLEVYLLNDFSIKAMAAETGMGYAAIRSRLDRLIAHYRELKTADEEKKRILERVAAGELTASEAAELIERIETE